MRTAWVVAIALISWPAWAARPNPPQVTVELHQAQARTLSDVDGDGVFESWGGLDVSSYSVASYALDHTQVSGRP